MDQRVHDAIGLQRIAVQAVLCEGLVVRQGGIGSIHGHGRAGEKLLHIEQARNDLLLNHRQQGFLAVVRQTAGPIQTIGRTPQTIELRHERSLQHVRVTIGDGKNRGVVSPAT